MIYFICLLIYFLSVLLVWTYFHLAHSRNGRWSNLKPDFGAVFLTVTPLFNTIFCFIAYITAYPVEYKSEKIKFNYANFFKIK